ncbi:hypothetical protein BD324DRAFT_651347 [Kockovaella imperatae]|uniref:GS catalytic domain-containing protein n=1 Tax=Kockovaella imperatae TaxID=4999 RepID=A0A1Y1UFM6_9TREE|nr:hypothetical protein BD324DRAFT_651347 [Kockovaella imperatae]ORX36870.1 hypothetical protein BD324DRAFT_651347 [Kockovaella imperatae]
MQLDQSGLLSHFLHSNPGIRKIRYQTKTYGNVTLDRFLTVARARQMAAESTIQGQAINVVCQTLRNFATTGHMDMDFEAGDDLWVPDYTTIKRCALYKDYASCMVNVIETQYINSSTPFALCPISTLRKAQEEAKAKGYNLLMGSEIEFYFLTDPDAEEVVPVTGSPLYNTAASRHPVFKVVDEAVDVLEANGLAVWGYHQEGASSKYEISLGPADPVTTIDNMIYASEVIKDLAYKHGYHVTMHPHAFPGKWPTAGQHWHVSVDKEGSKPGDAFLAGLLDHFPSVSAFLRGGYDSYQEGRRFWYGGGPVMWSLGNAAPIRRFGDSHFEARVGDALSNPYLQAAAIIAAGMDGIHSQMPLTMGPCEGRLGAGGSAAERDQKLKTLGVTKTLPETLAAAVKDLKGDNGAWLTYSFGQPLLNAYFKVKEDEAKNSGSMEEAVRRQAILRHI